MQTNLLKYLTSLFLLLAGTSVFAGEITSKIEFVQVSAKNSQFVVIKFVDDPTGSPNCSTDPRMAESLTTEAGKGILAIAMAAKASDRQVFVKGTGQCDVSSVMETISYIRLL